MFSRLVVCTMLSFVLFWNAGPSLLSWNKSCVKKSILGEDGHGLHGVIYCEGQPSSHSPNATICAHRRDCDIWHVKAVKSREHAYYSNSTLTLETPKQNGSPHVRSLHEGSSDCVLALHCWTPWCPKQHVFGEVCACTTRIEGKWRLQYKVFHKWKTNWHAHSECDETTTWTRIQEGNYCNTSKWFVH